MFDEGDKAVDCVCCPVLVAVGVVGVVEVVGLVVEYRHDRT